MTNIWWSRTYQAEQMQPAVGIFCALKAVDDKFIFVKGPLFDRDIYADDILPDDATCADVEMSIAKKRISKKSMCVVRCTYMRFVAYAYPTSELPMRPSLRPTAVPLAASSRLMYSFASESMLVVSPASIAFPFWPGLTAIPHPSWTLVSYEFNKEKERERR